MFAAHGYSHTTLQDISAAIGLTGPAIYRHFRSKAELFEVVMHDARLPAWEATLKMQAAGGAPRAVLGRMVEVWVEQSVARRALTAAYAQQHRKLSEAARQRIRVQHRALTDVWVAILGEIHPSLSLAERETMVDSAMWLLRSPAFFRSELPDARVTELLTTMIMGSLLTERLDDRADSTATSPTEREVIAQRAFWS